MASEHLLNEEVLDALPVAASVWRREAEDFVLVYVNRAGNDLTAGQGPMLRGRGLSDLYGPGSPLSTAMDECLATGKPSQLRQQGPMVTTGLPRELRLTFGAVAPHTVLVCVQDVTEGDVYRVAAADASSRFRAVFENAPIPMALVALAPGSLGELIEGNRAFAELMRSEPETLLGRAPLAWSHPDDRDVGVTEVQQLISGRGDKVSFVKRFTRDDGDVLWAEVHLSVVRGSDPCYGVLQIEDITEQRAQSQQLAESRARFRAMADRSRSLIYTYRFGESPGFDYVSPSAEAITGYSPQDFYADGLGVSRALLHPESASEFEDVTPLLDRWTTTRWRHRDGHDIWVEQIVTAIRGPAGELLGRQGEARDVTDQVQARWELRRLAAIVDLARDAIFAVGPEGEMQVWNARTLKMFGYRADAFEHLSLTHLLEPELVNRVLANPEQFVAGGGQSLVVEGHRQDGTIIELSLSISTVRSEQGDFAGLSFIARDLSEVSRHEQDLGRLLGVLDSSPDAIFAVSAKGAIMTWNRGAERTFGWSATEAIGGRFDRLVHGDGFVLDSTLTQAALGQSVTHEGRFRRRDGTWVDIGFSVSLMNNDRGFAVVARDITARTAEIRSTEQLQARLAELQRVHSIGQLAAGIAHDFNNLLAVIRLYGEFALQGLAAEDPVRADVERMRDAAGRGGDLTASLLSFSRRETELNEVVDCAEVVRDLALLLDRMLGDMITLRLEVDQGPLFVASNRQDLEQILLNLVTNARDAMPDGGEVEIIVRGSAPTQAGTATGATAEATGEVVLSVADSGPGMSAEVRDRVFEPFFTTKARGEGTGLGLATVYGAVTTTGGTIKIDSAPGAGTRFTVTLPLTTRPSPPEASVATPAPAAAAASGARLLIVGHDRELVKLVTRMLEEAGHETLASVSPTDALDLLRDPTVELDLLLSDVVMPDMSGAELVIQAHQLRPALRTVFMTAYPESSYRLPETAILLNKPFTGGQLIAVVNRALQAEGGASEADL